MTDPVALARPDLRGFVPYDAASPDRDIARLHANEAAWRHDWDDSRDGLNRYPDPRPARLIARLARLYEVPPEELLLTRGSDDAIDVLARALCRAGQDRIVICPPTFGMYAVAARLQGAAVDEVPLQADAGYAVDQERVLNVAMQGSKLVFLCSPNNPTGNPVPGGVVSTLCDALAGRALVVVDEAYGEFAGSSSVVPLRRSHSNLIVLRTLSKAYALAGARLGVLLGDARLVRLLRAVLPPYPIPSLSLDAAERLLQGNALERARREVAATVERREALAHALGPLDAIERVFPSEGNFLLIKCRDAAAVIESCRRYDVLVRDFGGNPGLVDCVRITVGDEEQNRRVVEAVGHVVAGPRE